MLIIEGEGGFGGGKFVAFDERDMEQVKDSV